MLTTLALSLLQATEASDPPPLALPKVALVGAWVHDFSSVEAAPRVATVLIEGERIVAVESDLELEPGTLRVDAEGLHLLPGLIDGLASMDPDHDPLYVAHGVTTVRDPGGDVALLEALRAPQIRDAVPGPHLLSAGAVFDGDPPTSAVAAVIQDPASVEPLVQTLHERLGVEFLNAQPGLGEAGLEALCEAAEARGLEVWSQGVRGVDFERALELGQRGFFGLGVLLPEGVQWSFVLPTAFIGRTRAAAEAGAMFLPMLTSHTRLMAPAELDPRIDLLSPDYEVLWAADGRARERLQSDPDFGPNALRISEKLGALALRLHRAGVVLLPGTSAPLAGAFPGASLIDELEAWVEAGFTRTEALRAATHDAALAFGLAPDRGRVAAGAIADLVLVDGDPRESLKGLRRPEAVVVRGRLLDRATLDDLLETVRVQQARVRAEMAAPLAIDPPVVPDDAALVMGGQVETKALGSRLSSEAWNAYRTPDGALHLRGRLLVPDQGRVAGMLLEIEQVVVDGRLDQFALRAQTGEDVVQVDGRHDASRFLIRRMFNGQQVDTRTVSERIGAINLSALADSVTTAFVLSQREQDGPMAVISFGDFFEPVLVRWQVDTGVGAERVLRTHQGGMVLRYDTQGGLTEWVRMAGQSVTATRPIRFSTFGGPGVRVRFEPGVAVEASAPAAEESSQDG
jgi:hypothetical protein